MSWIIQLKITTRGTVVIYTAATLSNKFRGAMRQLFLNGFSSTSNCCTGKLIVWETSSGSVFDSSQCLSTHKVSPNFSMTFGYFELPSNPTHQHFSIRSSSSILSKSSILAKDELQQRPNHNQQRLTLDVNNSRSLFVNKCPSSIQ